MRRFTGSGSGKEASGDQRDDQQAVIGHAE